jgi:hypothetical protein
MFGILKNFLLFINPEFLLFYKLILEGEKENRKHFVYKTSI